MIPHAYGRGSADSAGSRRRSPLTRSLSLLVVHVGVRANHVRIMITSGSWSSGQPRPDHDHHRGNHVWIIIGNHAWIIDRPDHRRIVISSRESRRRGPRSTQGGAHPSVYEVMRKRALLAYLGVLALSTCGDRHQSDTNTTRDSAHETTSDETTDVQASAHETADVETADVQASAHETTSDETTVQGYPAYPDATCRQLACAIGLPPTEVEWGREVVGRAGRWTELEGGVWYFTRGGRVHRLRLRPCTPLRGDWARLEELGFTIHSPTLTNLRDARGLRGIEGHWLEGRPYSCLISSSESRATPEQPP